MKKILFYSIALLTACTMMIGCKPKNEPKDPGQQQDTIQVKPEVKPAGVLFYYQFDVTDDMRDAGEFTVSYYDEGGNVQTEKLADSNTWKKTIVSGYPTKFGVKVQMALKADFDSTKYAVFNALRSYQYKAYSVDEQGNELKGGKGTAYTSPVSPLQMLPGKIEKYFEKYKDKPFHEMVLIVDEDCNMEYKSEWE